MKKQVSISIPKPCAENWNNFKSVQNGGHCLSCNKTVIDFTQMSDDEILDYFNNRREHTCGRFKSGQLKLYSSTNPPTIKPGFTLLSAGMLSLLLCLSAQTGSAQVAQPKIASAVSQHPQYPSTAVLGNKHIVKGVVKADDGSILPGVNVLLKGTEIGTVTDGEGKFEFPQALEEGDVLVFSFIGFDPMEYRVSKSDSEIIEIPLTLTMFTAMLGEVAVDGVYAQEQSFLSRIWGKFKSLF